MIGDLHFYLSFVFKHPLFIEGEACDYVHGVRDNICEEAGLHELRNEVGERLAPGGVEHVNGGLEGNEVEGVGGDEHDDESDDFAALAAPALEIPDAVHQVTVDGAENEPEEIGKFQIPVQKLVHYPDRCQGNEGVHDANQVVFDEMLHGEGK